MVGKRWGGNPEEVVVEVVGKGMWWTHSLGQVVGGRGAGGGVMLVKGSGEREGSDVCGGIVVQVLERELSVGKRESTRLWEDDERCAGGVQVCAGVCRWCRCGMQVGCR